MLIKALRSFCGTVTMCPKDKPREVSDSLAKRLIAAGYAEEVKPEKSEKAPENADPTAENEEESTPKAAKSAGKRAKK